jgi:hypothetical protein
MPNVTLGAGCPCAVDGKAVTMHPNPAAATIVNTDFILSKPHAPSDKW